MNPSPRTALLAAYWQSLDSQPVDALAAASSTGNANSAGTNESWAWLNSIDGNLTNQNQNDEPLDLLAIGEPLAV